MSVDGLKAFGAGGIGGALVLGLFGAFLGEPDPESVVGWAFMGLLVGFVAAAAVRGVRARPARTPPAEEAGPARAAPPAPDEGPTPPRGEPGASPGR